MIFLSLVGKGEGMLVKGWFVQWGESWQWGVGQVLSEGGKEGGIYAWSLWALCEGDEVCVHVSRVCVRGASWCVQGNVG